MTIIDRAFLSELFRRICENDTDALIATWRKKLDQELAQCKACPYDQMMGRRCCCMCLESSLGNTSLRLNLDDIEHEQLRAIGASIEAHRSAGCAICTTDTQD